jgi:CRISPR-associated protein Cmr6
MAPNLPRDTQNIITASDHIDNFNLLLNKYFKISAHKDIDAPKLKDMNKSKLVFDKKSWDENVAIKYYEMLESIANQKVTINYYQPKWRAIIGLGHPTVFETSLTLHHIYGFPYIPGQALKGIVRNYVIKEFHNSDEDKALKEARFYKLFGNQNQAGKVIFHDSYPITLPQIEFDIINTHYGDYYSQGKPPTDDQKLTPNSFLNIVRQGKYHNQEIESKFMIAFSQLEDLSQVYQEYGIDSLEQIITACLENQGMGAKTSVGYGYFEKCDIDADFYHKCKKRQKEKELQTEKELPKYKQMISKISKSFEPALAFIDSSQANKEEKKEVIQALIRHFCQPELWDSWKLNGQVSNYWTMVHNFYEKQAEKNIELKSILKTYAISKKQKKKLK